MQEDNNELNQQLEETNILYRNIEQQLVESKLQAATLDMEADQLSVELTQKNELLKKFSTKCTKLEIEVVQLQAQLGMGDSQEESLNTDSGQNGNQLELPVAAHKKKGVKSKLTSFFANKFKKNQKKGGDEGNNSGRGSGRGSTNNSAAAAEDEEEKIPE